MPAGLILHPTKRIKGRIRVPGDKSISHRAIMLGAIARGLTQIRNFLEADDCLRTVEAFIQMDVCIQRDRYGVWSVYGAGPEGLVEPRRVIDAGNSGTTMRLLLGILAGQSFSATITGDESLRRRPMRRVVEPLSRMGAWFYGRENANFAPIQVVGGKLRGIDSLQDFLQKAGPLSIRINPLVTIRRGCLNILAHKCMRMG